MTSHSVITGVWNQMCVVLISPFLMLAASEPPHAPHGWNFHHQSSRAPVFSLCALMAHNSTVPCFFSDPSFLNEGSERKQEQGRLPAHSARSPIYPIFFNFYSAIVKVLLHNAHSWLGLSQNKQQGLALDLPVLRAAANGALAFFHFLSLVGAGFEYCLTATSGSLPVLPVLSVLHALFSQRLVGKWQAQ